MEEAVNNSGAKLPYESTQMAIFLQKRVEELAPRKSQRQIANEVGYEKPNVFSMYKRGEAKFPIERLPALARALEVDFGYVFRLAMLQSMPGSEKEIAETFGSVTTKNQRDWLDVLEDLFKESDPVCTPARVQAIRAALHVV